MLSERPGRSYSTTVIFSSGCSARYLSAVCKVPPVWLSAPGRSVCPSCGYSLSVSPARRGFPPRQPCPAPVGDRSCVGHSRSPPPAGGCPSRNRGNPPALPLWYFFRPRPSAIRSRCGAVRPFLFLYSCRHLLIRLFIPYAHGHTHVHSFTRADVQPFNCAVVLARVCAVMQPFIHSLIHAQMHSWMRE